MKIGRAAGGVRSKAANLPRVEGESLGMALARIRKAQEKRRTAEAHDAKKTVAHVKAEMLAAIAAYQKPVKKLPAGYASGLTPDEIHSPLWNLSHGGRRSGGS